MQEDRENSKKIVFVTVGTTSFDALVKAVVSQNVKDELHKRGYTHLLIQMGRGIYFPTKLNILEFVENIAEKSCFCVISDYEDSHVLIQCDGADGSLVVDYFTFSSSITDYIRSASLVISHAGSGSIFETLKQSKPLIVVVNEDLMDNHQIELAEELEERKHLYCARPRKLHHALMKMELETLIR